MLIPILISLAWGGAGSEPLFIPHGDWSDPQRGNPVVKAVSPDYPRSCFEPGRLPTFETSYVEGTLFYEYESEVVDQQNPGALRAPVGVRAWRTPCHFEGSALLIEFRRLGGLPLAPRVGVRQGEDAFNVRISYEANTLITDDTGAIIPTFEGSDERTVFVVGATPATVAGGIDLDGELDLLLRHARFDAILSFPAYDPTAFGVSGFQPINPRHSGSWYNIVRDGEGVFVEIYEEDSGEEGVFISWYTYRDGVQQWLVGSSPLGEDRTRIEVPLIRTTGASFGDEFAAADVQREAWGTATLAFRSCNRMRFQYAGADGAGSIEMSRLTILADFDCR